MTPSILGGSLPESLADFQQLRSAGQALYPRCSSCGECFSDTNTLTPAGWRETQISGKCERCYDGLFAEGKEA